MADQRVEFHPGTSTVATAASLESDHEPIQPIQQQRLGNRVWKRFQSDTGEVASWLIFMAALVAAAVAAALIISTVITTLADDVAVAAETGEVRPRGTVPDNGDRDPGDGSVDPGDAEAGDPDAEPLPIRTSHCLLTVKASAAAVGLGVGLGSTVEVIIKEMADGRTIVTIAGEVAANGGPGTSAGAGVTVNDATVGAYAAASAKAWGSVGGGVQYELAPGETVADLFAGLAVSSNPVTGVLGNGINAIFPDTIPTASLPNTLFVDGEVWGAAGGTAQAGIGWVSAGANAQATATTNQTYAIHDDGTYSATTSYSGALSGDAGVTGGIPFFAWGTAGVAGEATGSISVRTIYNGSFEAIEMVVTTSYGYDGDAILGSDDDNPTITTQQWTLDLTNTDVQQAVNDLGPLVPSGPSIPQIPSQLPTDAFDVLAANATTFGAVTQELSTSEVDIAIQAGAIVAGVSGGLTGTCTELQ